MAMMSTEITRLNNLLNSREETIEEWMKKVSVLETSMLDLKQKEKRTPQEDSRIKLLMEEIERVNRMAKSRTEELEEWQ